MPQYLKNKDLLAEVIICRKAFLKAAAPHHKGINDPDKVNDILNKFADKNAGAFLSPKLAEMLFLIPLNIAKKPNYYSYTWIDDMKGDALLTLCRKWWRFNPEASSNPFAYYTTVTERCFLTYLAAQKKQRDIKDEIIEYNGMTPSFGRQLDNDIEQREARNQLAEEIPITSEPDDSSS